MIGVEMVHLVRANESDDWGNNDFAKRFETEFRFKHYIIPDLSFSKSVGI